MSNQKGYIYIRHNEWFKTMNLCKVGITSDITNRDGTYNTGEPKKGIFECVISVPLELLHVIDDIIKDHLLNYNIYYDGGTEFYNIHVDIYGEIIKCLENFNIPYDILTRDEIANICRTKRETPEDIKTKLKKSVQTIRDYVQKNRGIIEPKKHQKDVLDIITEFYNNNNIGKLIWGCGLGKTLLSIFIVKKLGFKTVVIGVPSVNLQEQFLKDILKIYPDENNIFKLGGKNSDYDDVKTLQNFISTNSPNPLFIITTYSSCKKIVDADIKIDFKIGDEAHHLTGLNKDDNNTFLMFHNIQSKKTLFMTATEKNLPNKDNVYSMEKELQFGKTIDNKSIKWAIDNKYITDYNVLLLKNTLDEINKIITTANLDVKNKELFVAAYTTLKTFELYKKASTY